VARYRDDLPQLASRELVLTDGGIETDLIFHEGFDLPLFAAFVLLDDQTGLEALRYYYRRHIAVAEEAGVGFILEAPTWRANIDWARQLGHDKSSISDVNRRAIDLLLELRQEAEHATTPLIISGAIGPRYDAYRPSQMMTTEEAQEYHRPQVATFAATEADLVSALTLTNAAEAIGITRAAQEAHVPVALSFTVETDGLLPDGSSFAQMLAAVDDATEGYPAYFGINCAHPSHFVGILDHDATWLPRLRMIRANASRLSHAELDEASGLDEGNPDELGEDYAAIIRRCPQINVLGGCCGTDARHIRSIARFCL
jgi:S-methylmethionine-dependent homocysteine/selenocysteine methylase